MAQSAQGVVSAQGYLLVLLATAADGPGFAAALSGADRALYRAKPAGRDRVEVATPAIAGLKEQR